MGFFSDIIKGIGKLFNAILEPLLGWLVPKPPAKEGIKIDRQGSDNSIPIVYGTQKVGAIKVHKYVTDQAGGAKNEFLHLICVFAEGEVDAIEEVFFNGISENDTQWNKDGGGKWHRINRYIGSPTQTADSAAIAEIPNWTSLHTLSGLCYAYIRLELDKNQTVWRGEPQITARIRGRKLFDPRNSATAYSENPALVLRDYLTNSIYGKGLNPARLDSASFIAAANFCDTPVTNTVTRTVCAGEFDINDEYTYSCTTETVTESKALFSCNIFLDTGQTVFDNIKEILGTFRGILPLSAGSIKLSVERDGDPVFNFNDGNIVGSIDVDSGSINDRYNRVEVRFPNEAKDFENDSVFYPPDDDPLASQWLDEDGGVRLEQSFEFTGITKKDEAIQMAEIVAKKSRFTKSVGFESQPIGIVVEAGDIVSLTNTMHGWIEKPFRVIEKTINDDDTVKFAMVEHEDAIYPWSGVTFDELSGGTFLGDPTKIPAPTAPNLQPDLTLAETGLLTWSYENNAFIRSYEVEITSGGLLVLGLQSFGQSVTVPLLDSGSYVANIYAISSTGYRSPSLAYSFNLAAPVQPSAITLTARDWEIDAQPVLAGIGIGTEFEFDIVQGDGTGYTPTAKAKGASYTATGLLPDTLYTVFARSVNAFGTSAWVSESATTTITGAQSQPFLDELEYKLSVLDDVLGGVDALIEEVSQDIANEYERVANTEEIRQVRIDNLAKAEALVNEYLEELGGETLPELNARLEVAEQEIDDLENVTLPALNDRLDSAETELTVLTDTTIPQVQSDLDIAQGQIATIQGEVFAATASVPQTIDDVLEEIAQDTAEIFQEIYASRIGANSITALAIKANAVTADKIVANAITADKIAANAITADKIQANAIDGRTITGLTINGAVINAGTLNAIDIVGTSTISGASIIGNNISGGTISGAAMTAGSITSAAISAGSIVGTSIEGAFIGGTEIIGGDISGTNITGTTITGGFIFGTEIEGVTITGSTSIFSPTISGGTIQGTNITATNTITGATINGAAINTGTLTGNTINGGTINSLTANSVTLNTSTMNAGTINSVTINTSTLTGNTVNGGTVTGSLVRTAASGSRVEVQDDGTYLVWGGDGTKNDGNAAFFVKKNGSAKFAGDISGSSGTFNGTVKAENIIGETVGGAIVDINRTFAPITNGAEERILNMSIAPSAIVRDIIIPPLLVQSRSPIGDSVGLIKIKVNGVLAKQQSIPIPITRDEFGDTLPDNYVTSRQFGVELPASASSTSVEVYIQVNVNFISIGINGSDSVVFAVSRSEEITILSP
jgi:uncharacterized protein YjbI with pentapeptide repeats